MPAFQHHSVLLAETLAVLTPRDGEVYCDCTLGGGGHTEAILEAAPTCRVIGIDRDLEALAAARAHLARFGERVTFVHGTFGDLGDYLRTAGIEQVHGILADLGVSSWQLDSAARGFSFGKSGPVDMRMDQSQGATALELIATLEASALADVIYELGEERHSRRIAAAIKRAHLEGRLANTADLAGVIAAQIPEAEKRRSKIHPATRTFQALRLAVNAELDQLQRLLTGFPDYLAADGRCAIISFHSLEDRLVKQRFRELAFASSLPPHLASAEGERSAAVCEPITRKAVVASDEEIAKNPRARSTRLRATRRTTFPNLPSHKLPFR